MKLKRFNTLNEKWKGKEVEVEKTGEYADKTIAELKKMKSDLKKENDKYQEEGKAVPKKNKEKMSEIVFAIRAKGGWKKGEGATNESLDGETSNYMFFGNLETMKRLVDMLLEMDKSQIDNILNEHDWASDHISVATENLEQVFDFLAGVADKSTEYDDRFDGVSCVVEPEVKSFNDFKGDEGVETNPEV